MRRLPVVDNGQAAGIAALGDLAVERDPDPVLGGAHQRCRPQRVRTAFVPRGPGGPPVAGTAPAAASAWPPPRPIATNTATWMSPPATPIPPATRWAPSSPPCATQPKPAASKRTGSPNSTPSA
ncbi:hypothetical protein ACWCQB_35985 [Streptomyces hirsutus]